MVRTKFTELIIRLGKGLEGGGGGSVLKFYLPNGHGADGDEQDGSEAHEDKLLKQTRRWRIELLFMFRTLLIQS